MNTMSMEMLEAPGVQKSSGLYHTAIVYDGRLYTFGDNVYGQLGNGTNISVEIPMLIPSLFNVTNVSCGDFYTAVVADGKLYTFGNGECGQLGHNNDHHVNVPTMVAGLVNVTNVGCGGYHTAVVAGCNLYTFGSNGYGKLGLDYETKNLYVPKLVTELELHDVEQVACGTYHTAVVANGKKLYTCGENWYGQLGFEHNDHKNFLRLVDGLDNVTQVRCGRKHTIVVANGHLHVFGSENV